MSTRMKFAMVRINQGAGDIESLRGHKDRLEFVGLASGRLIDAIGSIAELMKVMDEAVERVAE